MKVAIPAEADSEPRVAATPDTVKKLKAYAEKSLPTIKEHLKMAKEVQAKVGGADAGQPDTGARTTTRGRANRRTPGRA